MTTIILAKFGRSSSACCRVRDATLGSTRTCNSLQDWGSRRLPRVLGLVASLLKVDAG
jgi:hypothetical protein